MTDSAAGDAGTALGEVGLLLPSAWWTIRLADVEARRRSIAQLVERQVGRADEHAALRGELRRELELTAERTATAGGVLLAISTMTAGDLPIPASLAVYRVGRHAMTDADAGELAALLEGELAADDRSGDASSAGSDEPSSAAGDEPSTAGDDPAALPQVEVRAGQHGPVVRRLRLAPGPEELEAQDQTLFVADYWLDAGDGTLTNLTFSSPLVALAAPLLDLFETVVATLAVAPVDDEVGVDDGPGAAAEDRPGATDARTRGAAG
ncbi:hypothetical protein [Cellulomonas alba]|uniref:ESX secretion-associated protein EspG n=1 Tax=Cellulomonas alba TaxID=3053467 RepID=A0ABT7SGE0_9CELL|nr:hypothetical protein [Cellulomonas alba]MDM7855109.1 hypothetical protein [Cellulomonas alba]